MNNNNNSSIEEFVRENAIMIGEENRNRGKMFKCKNCNQEYDTFQALGGHSASHRRFKGRRTGDNETEMVLHACKICEKKFESGHSLGGHMRKHLVTVAASSSSSNSVSFVSLVERKDLINGKVVFEYDLNLTPVENEKAIRGKASSSYSVMIASKDWSTV